MKMNRNFMIIFLVSMLLVSNAAYKSADAANKYVKIKSWYSDSITVGYWSFSPYVSFTNLNNSFEISSYVNNAVTKWRSAGISSYITVSPANADIRAFSGTRAQLNAMGMNYDSSTNGLTVWNSSKETGSTNGARKIRKLSRVTMSVCKEAGKNYYKNVTMHELGHALGWMGHHKSSKAIMYKYSKKNVVSISTEDKKQLKQIYNAMNK